MEAAPDVTGGLRFVDVNCALEHAVGSEIGQLAALPLDRIAAPEAAATLHAIAAAVDANRPWRGDLACLGRAALPVCIGCDLIPAAPKLYVLVGRDVTAQRAEAQSARTLNNLLAKAFQAADVPLAITNADGRFVMTNQSMDAQLGCQTASPAGKFAVDFLAPDSRPLLLAARARQDADGMPFRSDVELQHANGHALPVVLSSCVVEGLDRSRFSVLTTRARDTETSAKPPPRREAASNAPARIQVAGQLRFIDLDAVRAVLGDRWETIRHRSMDAAEKIIRKRLSPGDTVDRDADLGFTICFATGAAPEATFRATAIARQIRLHLISLGEDENALSMQVVVARVLVNPNQSAAAQIAQHLDRAAAHGLRAAQAPLQPPRAETVFAAASGAPAGTYLSPMPRPAVPGSIILSASTPDEDAALIHWALGIDIAQPPQPMFIDLSFDLFVRRDRAEAFLGNCAKLAPSLRPHLNFLLTGLPEGVTTSLMQNIERQLKPYGAGVGWHLDNWAAPSFDLRACPLTWAVMDLAGWAGPPAAVPERLRRVSTLLVAQGVKPIAAHVVSMAAMKALHAVGVDRGTLAEVDAEKKP